MLGALGCCIHSMVHCLLLQILNIAIVLKIVGKFQKMRGIFLCRFFQGLGISFLQNGLSISARWPCVASEPQARCDHKGQHLSRGTGAWTTHLEMRGIFVIVQLYINHKISDIIRCYNIVAYIYTHTCAARIRQVFLSVSAASNTEAHHCGWLFQDQLVLGRLVVALDCWHSTFFCECQQLRGLRFH